MKNYLGTIARLTGVRRFRLVAPIMLTLVAGTSLVGLWSDETPVAAAMGQQSRNILSFLKKADFNRDALFLNGKDRALYHQIFALQAAGDWKQADPLIANLDDPLLVGHVLYQRYMTDANYKSQYQELNAWLQDFGDQPNADKVYRLAERRRTDTDPELNPLQMIPVSFSSKHSSTKLGRYVQNHFRAMPKPKATAAQTKLGNALAKEIKNDVAADRVSRALESFNKKSNGLTSAQQGVLLSQIAMGYYQNGKFSHARLVAQRAWRERGAHQPIASWIAGLAAWQLKDYGASQQYFARIADSADATKMDPWFYSAGAFWASRAAGRQGNQSARMAYLQKASVYPTTFYGLLAHGALGRQFKPGDTEPADVLPFNRTTVGILAKQPAGERMLALLDVGQLELAADEMKQWIQSQSPTDENATMRAAVAALAKEFGLDDVREALNMQSGQNPVLQAAFEDDTMFPVLQEAVATSKTVDPALIHALIRQESRFDPKAQNKTTGASGLMQLMPRTAKFIGERQDVDKNALLNPKLNLQLGQRYVDYLLRQPHVDGNLLYLAVAYNAGPGNLQAWQQEIKAHHDPLLFIESIPFGQTRAFVEHVMTNYWIYRMRLGQEAPDVQALLDGEWPQHPTVQRGVNLALAN